MSESSSHFFVIVSVLASGQVGGHVSNHVSDHVSEHVSKGYKISLFFLYYSISLIYKPCCD